MNTEMELSDSLDNVIVKAKAIRESHDRLVSALCLCMPLMKAEWQHYGPREPEAVALRQAAEALLAAEHI